MIQTKTTSLAKSRPFFITILFLAALLAAGIAPGADAPEHANDRASTDTRQTENPDSGHGQTQGELEAGGEHGNGEAGHDEGHEEHVPPNLFWILPFVILLLCIALLPLVHSTEEWWEKNSSKLTVAMVLATITCLYYLFREHGFHADPGIKTVLAVLNHAVLMDYIPFIVLLFSLYTISGGISVRGDIPAHPLTNTVIIGIGALLASFIGTTGVAMLLIRPLLQINSERKYVKHTVIFFIFLVCNIGGCLLPIGDPPLFLGYLRGVPFLWTFNLTLQWLVCSLAVLAVYFVWDTIVYRKESKKDIQLDETQIEPLRIRGKRNLWLLGGVVLAVAFLVPDKKFLGSQWVLPNFYLREIVQLALAAVSMVATPKSVRKSNDFNFIAIGEVACLFIGIFVCMQVPIEYLSIKGGELGLSQPWHFFWATGILSSFLDNAPTYVVYFSTAGALPIQEGTAVLEGVDFGAGTFDGQISVALLTAISCGAVFMGAMTYIGNGPNFMVKSIAEQSGVKMPSFFGYMVYSCLILLPIFVVITFIFF